jgi:hypothetical protein
MDTTTPPHRDRGSPVKRSLRRHQHSSQAGAGESAIAPQPPTEPIAPQPPTEPIAPSSEQQERPSPGAAVDLLVAVLDSVDATVFHNPANEAFVSLLINDRRETWSAAGDELSNWLQHQYYNQTRRPLPEQALKDVVALITARARFDGPTHDVYRRVAALPGMIVLDLSNRTRDVVIITPDGWTISHESPVCFDRSGTSALPLPSRGRSIEDLKSFVNTDGEGFALVVGFLLGVLRGRGPYSLLVLGGEQGSAKSTASRVCRALVDPQSPALRAAPKNEADLMIAAQRNAVLCFDNLSNMPTWLSDALCRLATGGGSGARKLYSDKNEVVMEAMRPVILNGIETLAVRGDLADRSSIVTLNPILDSDRETEAEFGVRFDECHSGILGALLDAAVAGLANEQKIRLPRLPRMADFVRWVCACERGLPQPEGTFMRAFVGSRESADRTLLESHTISRPIFNLCQRTWRGTATELLQAIGPAPQSSRLDWPKNARELADQIRRIAPSMRRLGYEIISGLREGHNRTRIIVLRRVVGDTSSSPSPIDSSASSASSAIGDPLTMDTAGEFGADHADHADDVNADEPGKIIRR